MPATIRTFEKEVNLVTQAQYVVDDDWLVLKRWRVVADGQSVGGWRKAVQAGENGGWPMRMRGAEVRPAQQSEKPRRKRS